MKFVNLIFFLSPKYIKNYLRRINETKIIKEAKERLKVKVTNEYLIEIFDSSHINSDLFVHTSIMNIGKIQGGYKEIVKLLNKNILEKNFTLLFSALAFKGSSIDYLKEIKIFDIRKAPVATGVINEYYSQLAIAERSLSPTHSVVAIGLKAEYYTKKHHLSETPFNENSPYFKIAQNKGKILMFGAGLNHLTFIHVIEDLLGSDFPFKVYSGKKYKIELINKTGTHSFGYFKAHNSFMGIFRNTDIITNPLRLLPTTRIFKLGCSEYILLDARDVIVSLLETLQDGKTAYGKVKLTIKAKEKTKYWITYFKSL